MTRIKICGITNKKDAVCAVKAGADALGFIFVKQSPRKVSLSAARKICADIPPFVSRVGVFSDAKKEDVIKTVQYCRLDTVQLHGDESDKYCAFIKKYCKIVKVFRVKDLITVKKALKYKNADAFLFDTYISGMLGGTGKTFSHDLLKNVKFERPIIISGGISINNVKKIIKKLDPYGIDISSSIERSPGMKNLTKMRQIINIVKSQAQKRG